MSPTTVTGAAICTTLLSFINSSFVFAHIASMTESASSSFLYSRDMHSSRSTVAIAVHSQQMSLLSSMRSYVANLEGLACSPLRSQARYLWFCVRMVLGLSFSHRRARVAAQMFKKRIIRESLLLSSVAAHVDHARLRDQI